MAQPFIQSFKKAVAITPSDTTFLTDNAASAVPTVGTSNPLYKAFWVGGAGVVACQMADGTTVNFTCVAGSLLPLNSVQRVMATNTTATLIVGLA